MICLGIYLIKYFKLSVIIWKRNIGKYGGFYWLKMDFDIYKKNLRKFSINYDLVNIWKKREIFCVVKRYIGNKFIKFIGYRIKMKLMLYIFVYVYWLFVMI